MYILLDEMVSISFDMKIQIAIGMIALFEQQYKV